MNTVRPGSPWATYIIPEFLRFSLWCNMSQEYSGLHQQQSSNARLKRLQFFFANEVIELQPAQHIRR